MNYCVARCNLFEIHNDWIPYRLKQCKRDKSEHDLILKRNIIKSTTSLPISFYSKDINISISMNVDIIIDQKLELV